MYSLELSIGATYKCQRSADAELDQLEHDIKAMAEKHGFEEVVVEITSKAGETNQKQADWHYVAGDSDE